MYRVHIKYFGTQDRGPISGLRVLCFQDSPRSLASILGGALKFTHVRPYLLQPLACKLLSFRGRRHEAWLVWTLACRGRCAVEGWQQRLADGAVSGSTGPKRAWQIPALLGKSWLKRAGWERFSQKCLVTKGCTEPAGRSRFRGNSWLQCQ